MQQLYKPKLCLDIHHEKHKIISVSQAYLKYILKITHNSNFAISWILKQWDEMNIYSLSLPNFETQLAPQTY